MCNTYKKTRERPQSRRSSGLMRLLLYFSCKVAKYRRVCLESQEFLISVVSCKDLQGHHGWQGPHGLGLTFWVSILSFKIQPVKRISGRILGLAWLHYSTLIAVPCYGRHSWRQITSIGRHRCPYMQAFKTKKKTFLLLSKLFTKPFRRQIMSVSVL